MNASPYLHLVWKEYRAIRLLWMSLAALVLFLVWLTWLIDDMDPNSLMRNFALGGPVFFAVGCAGSAFAVEKEEGTFEFLRAAPIRSSHVVASKLAVVALATLAMFLVLWPLTTIFKTKLPETVPLPGMLGLWLIAAIEAIAWGTLFSLLTARPLMSVVLGIAAASIAAHGIALFFTAKSDHSFEWLSYLRAAPWRALAAVGVLGIDIYLGRRWLHGSLHRSTKGHGTPELFQSAAAAGAESAALQRMLAKRSRSTMLARLLWQYWRHSRWLIVFMAVLFVALAGCWLPWILSGRVVRVADEPVAISMALVASLMGSFVFLSDQEGRRYRFYAEHNVPPHYVWLSRQIPWIATLILCTIVVSIFWLGLNNIAELWRFMLSGTSWHNPWYEASGPTALPRIFLPPLGMGVAYVVASYGVGQWSSMFIRSGLMAAFCGIVLNIFVCMWVTLMCEMQVPFWWSVLPIPLVLLWATWRRAPDWISENTTWRARGRAAGSLLIPAAAILIALPVFRVQQVPEVSPGFDVAAYRAELEKDYKAGLEAAEKYRRAGQVFLENQWEVPPDVADAKGSNGKSQNSEAQITTSTEDSAVQLAAEIRRPPSDAELRWLRKNDAALQELLAATEGPTCLFYDPDKPSQFPGMPIIQPNGLAALLITSGRELESAGRMDEALDRYFTALKFLAEVSNVTHVLQRYGGNRVYYGDVLLQMAAWAAQKDQTPKSIQAALQRLIAFDADTLHSDDALKSLYVVTEQMLDGNEEARQAFFRVPNVHSGMGPYMIWSTLMPWENDRARRVLNVITEAELKRLIYSRQAIAHQGDDREELGSGFGYAVSRAFPYESHENAMLIATTLPELGEIVQVGSIVAREMVGFEARRRGTMIVLAIEAYRLEHGKLPDSLDELMGTYFDKWPIDPYSGLEFRYFPKRLPGVHRPLTEVNSAGDWLIRRQIEPDQPGVWCAGPDLEPMLSVSNTEDSSLGDQSLPTDPQAAAEPFRDLTERLPNAKRFRVDGYRWAGDNRMRLIWGDVPQTPLPDTQVWVQGMWFPIPAEAKK